MAEILMPRLSEEMEVGTIVRWLRADGDRVRRGDGIVEIEADKTTKTHEADADGVLRIAAREGETLPVGAPIGRIEPADGEAGDGEAAATAGPRGAVAATEPARAELQHARRVAEARATVPHLTLRASVDMTAAEELLAALGADPAPTAADLLVRAAALALAEQPKVNGAYRDAKFERFERVNVGVVLATGGAPVTATVFDADRLGPAAIAVRTRELADGARAGSLASPELAGGTFTVWPPPGTGVRAVEPVVMPGQAAALGAGDIEELAVARGGELTVRRVVELELACDHRILTLEDGAAFLGRVRELLEAPAALAG